MSRRAQIVMSPEESRASSPSSASSPAPRSAATYQRGIRCGQIRNLERDPRCTLQVEAGESYDQLEIFERYTGGPVDPEGLRAQAAKRVGLQFVVRDVVSFDHRKLAGVY